LNHSSTKKMRRQWPEARVGKVMAAPSLILIFALAIYPLLYTIFISFTELNMRTGETQYKGAANYIQAFTSGEFWNSVWVTLLFTILSLVIQLPLGVLVALLLNQEFKGRWLLRSIVLVPWAVPTLVNSTLWNWIFNTQYGAANRLLMQFNLISEPIIWFDSPMKAMGVIVFADTWRMLPLYVLMMLASLQTIPQSQIEAAILDGAGAFSRFRNVILPLIKPMLLVVLVIRTMQALKVFDIIYMLTHGGPANGTMVISYYIYNQSFGFMHFSYGAALAIIVAVISTIITVLYVKILKTDDIY